MFLEIDICSLKLNVHADLSIVILLIRTFIYYRLKRDSTMPTNSTAGSGKKKTKNSVVGLNLKAF